MKKIAILAGLLALAGCGTTDSKLYTFTVTDLNNAITIDKAAAANPTPAISGPAKVKLQCDQWVLTNLTLLQNQTTAAPVTGFFSATSAADTVANNVLSQLGPAGQADFELGCGPEVVHLVGLVTGFKSLQLVAPSAVTAIK